MTRQQKTEADRDATASVIKTAGKPRIVISGSSSTGPSTVIKTATTRKPAIVLPRLIDVHPQDEPRYRALIETAKQACLRAYRPYSKFNVGAAVLTFDGRVYSGCNVENCGYTQTKHAEEVAITVAIADGALDRAAEAGLSQFEVFLAIAIYAPKGSDPWPCCNCRQSLCEFGFDMHVIGEGAKGEILCLTLGQLIPFPFPIAEVLASVHGSD
jgi:cytidine deaminase